MTRKEMVKLVSLRKNAGVSKKVALSEKTIEQVLDAFFSAVGECLSMGEEVKLVNFGKFEARNRNAVIRRNPKTGEPVSVPAKVGIGFKPSPKLRQIVNTPHV